MVTAAHCLYKDDELVAAKTLSILLGLHDRSKKTESKRCPKIVFPVLPLNGITLSLTLVRRSVCLYTESIY